MGALSCRAGADRSPDFRTEAASPLPPTCFIPAQHLPYIFFHAADEFTDFEGLVNVFRHLEFFRPLVQILFGITRHEDLPHGFAAGKFQVFTHFPDRFNAVHSGHAYVANNEINVFQLYFLQRFDTAPANDHIVLIRTQGFVHGPDDQILIIHKQNPAVHAASLRRKKVSAAENVSLLIVFDLTFEMSLEEEPHNGRGKSEGQKTNTNVFLS
jgi:hypothetical protein